MRSRAAVNPHKIRPAVKSLKVKLASERIRPAVMRIKRALAKRPRNLESLAMRARAAARA